MSVQRILDHQPVYAGPSVDYTPLLYSPFYYYVCAPFAYLFGNGLVTLRLVSFLATLGCFLFLFLIVFRRTSSVTASWLAVSLYAATYAHTNYWFEIAKCDSVLICFLLAALYVCESALTWFVIILGPVLLSFAFLTKQAALVPMLAMSLGVVLGLRPVSWTKRITFVAILASLLTGFYAYFNTTSQGWYHYYVFTLGSERYNFSSFAFWRFWYWDTGPFVIAILLSLAVIGISLRQFPKSFRLLLWDVLILGSFIALGFMARIHDGAAGNSLMPLYVIISAYFGIGFHLVLQKIGRNAALCASLFCAAILQFLFCIYSPEELLPSQAVEEQLALAKAQVSVFSGPVYWPEHPWLLHEVGKPAVAFDGANVDIYLAHKSQREKDMLTQSLSDAVAQGRFDAFVVEPQDFLFRPPNFDTYYVLSDMRVPGNVYPTISEMKGAPFGNYAVFIRRSLLNQLSHR